MLESCLNYYGIYDNLHISLSLHKLKELAFEQHPSGYLDTASSKLSLSYFEIKNLLRMHQNSHYEHIIHEVFRYAAFFGIITDVVISPFHIEWRFNSYHQRDLFFSKLRLDIRAYNKFSSILE